MFGPVVCPYLGLQNCAPTARASQPNAEESTRQHAQTLLKQIDQVEEQKSRFEAVRKARGNGSPSSTTSQTDNSETVSCTERTDPLVVPARSVATTRGW
jgi:hypothetical protein